MPTIELKIGKGIICRNLPKKAQQKIEKDLCFDNPEYLSAMKQGRFIPADMASHLHLYYSENGKYWIPRGYIFYLRKYLRINGFNVKIKDYTLLLKPLKLSFLGKLRPYQKEAQKDVVSYPVGVLEAATGSGKTVMAISIIVYRQQPTLIIVHSKELLYQWKEAIKKFTGEDCGLIGDGKFKIKPITVGIINTVKKNVPKLEKHFGQIICDECFPAGTMIDNKQIENIKIGDYVRSFNHKTNKIELKKVTHLFKNKPKIMCTVKLKNNKEITCTTKHQFYTEKGYLTASKLNSSLSVLDIGELLNKKEIKNGQNTNSCMCYLWKTCKMSRQKTLSNFIRNGKKKQCQMFRKMRTNKISSKSSKKCELVKQLQQEICQQLYEKTQSNVQSKKYRKNESNKTCKRNIKYMDRNERGKWNIHSPTREDCDCFGMENGSSYKNSRSYSKRKENKMVQKEKSTNNIQSRCGKQEVKNCNRGRRGRTCWSEEKTRQEKRLSFKMERVESVTIHKQGSGSEFKKMCPDGFVYNIEVEDNNNYFVNNILVHNCHRTAASTWSETIQDFPAKHYLGLTATPFRRDGLGHAIFASLGPKRHKVNKKMLFKTKAVLKPDVYKIQSNFNYFFTNDYSTMISKLTQDEARNCLITSTIRADLKRFNENVLIVSDRKKHCLEMQKILFDKYMIDSLVLTGSVNKKERQRTIEQVKTGKCKVLFATISLIGEGFDAPDLTTLILTTPVKFSGRLIQACGRVLRPKKNKIPRIYDIRDDNINVLRYSGFNRDRIYKKEWGGKE